MMMYVGYMYEILELLMCLVLHATGTTVLNTKTVQNYYKGSLLWDKLPVEPHLFNSMKNNKKLLNGLYKKYVEGSI